jgi:lysophospholipase-2
MNLCIQSIPNFITRSHFSHHLRDLLSELDLPVKIICPTAPVMPVSLNRGMKMPSWFDVHHLGEGSKYDVESLTKSAAEIHTLLESDVLEGIDPSHIFFGGLSQGGALATYSAYTYPKNFAGIILLSCWLPVDQPTFLSSVKFNQSTPVLQGHSEGDRTVKYESGCVVADTIKTFNADNHHFKSYKSWSHYVFPEELKDVKDFIMKLLPTEDKK